MAAEQRPLAAEMLAVYAHGWLAMSMLSRHALPKMRCWLVRVTK